MRQSSVQQLHKGSGKRLPDRIRYLCMSVCILLVASTLVELWIMLEGWFTGEAFQTIYQECLKSYPELADYPIGGMKIYASTLILDLVAFIPYYVALLLSAVIFYRFIYGVFWDSLNIKLLKINSALIIFDASFPALNDMLQMLLFTSGGKFILILSCGLSAEGIRSFIIGLAIYTFSMILSSAKELADDHKLII